MENVLIKDVKVFVTAPKNINLVVVKIETSREDIVGYGCATFTWRYKPVVVAIEEYLKPMLIGKSVHNIEDLWQTMKGSSYWRNGPVLNNAISGIDEALWDIKGKLANMPLYSLLGGKSREGLLVYVHADGNSYGEVKENIQKHMENGFTHIRCHMGTYGGNFDGSIQQINKPVGSPDGSYFHPKTYMKSVVNLFENVRADFGFDIEVMHDVHERLTPIDSLAFAKELEQFKLFFLEDCLSPDQCNYFKNFREQTSTPFAMGELFTNSTEWKTVVQNQWIDFMRVHLSDIGGLTPAIKLAHFCEAYKVRTAWHGPSDLTPIGMAVQMHLGLNSANFGIQEFSFFTEAEQAVFPGCPTVKGCYAYVSDRPGIGVGFDENEAKKYPPVDMDTTWLFPRLPDGTSVRP